MIAPQLDDSSGVGILGAVYIWSGFSNKRASHHSFDPVSYDLTLSVLGNRGEHPHKADSDSVSKAAWLDSAWVGVSCAPGSERCSS